MIRDNFMVHRFELTDPAIRDKTGITGVRAGSNRIASPSLSRMVSVLPWPFKAK